MNRTKRNLILASAILNLCNIVFSLIISVLIAVNPEMISKLLADYVAIQSISINWIYQICVFLAGLIGSIFLLFSIRENGKYFDASRGIYIAGVVIVILVGGLISWILLLIAGFTPNVIIINDRTELRETLKEEKNEEILKDQAYEEKKAKIEDLKRLRDAGVISEEEYKEKLFDLL